MRSRGKQGKFSLVILFVGIFAFWWGISVLAQNEKNSTLSESNSTQAVMTGVPQTFAGVIPVTITIKDNEYIYSGTVPLTSPCDRLGSGITSSGQDPKHVTVLLTLKKPIGVCSDTSNNEATQDFSVSMKFTSNTKAVLEGVTVNGSIAQTSVKLSKAK